MTPDLPPRAGSQGPAGGGRRGGRLLGALALGALALGGLALLLAPGCGDEGGATGSGAGDGRQPGFGPQTVPDSGMPAPTSVWNPYPDMGAPVMRLRDASERSGITTTNHSGTLGVKEFLIEAVGVGPAWLDYDRDGLLDVYIPDGDVFSNYELVHQLDPATKANRPVLRRKAQPKLRHKDQLWRNNGDGTFTDVAEKAGVADEGWSFGATAFDFDADGWTDIYLANFGVNRLWHNNGNGTFSDVALEHGAATPEHLWTTCSAAADLDGDDRLDLYVPAYADPAAEVERQRVERGLALGTPVEAISGRSCGWKRVRAYCGPLGLQGQHDLFLRQRSDGVFEDRAVAVGMRPPVARYGFQALAWDFNEDGWMDVYVANDSVESFLWQAEVAADGALRFREVSDHVGVKYGSNLTPQAGMGATVADINADGLFDIFKTNFALDYNNMYIAHRTRPDGGALYFRDRGLAALGQAVFYDLSWGCGWVDFDNDGDLDLYVANGHVYKEIDLQKETGSTYEQLNTLIECVEQGAMGYREIGRKAVDNLGAKGAHLGVGDGMDVRKCSRGTSFADYNNDGKVDMLVTNMNQPPDLILNATPSSPDRAWALISLEQPGMNREALGAALQVTAAGRTQVVPVIRASSFLGSNDPRVHLGLGAAKTFDVRVTWPGRERARTVYRGLAPGRHWLLKREGERAEELPLKTFEVPLPPEK